MTNNQIYSLEGAISAYAFDQNYSALTDYVSRLPCLSMGLVLTKDNQIETLCKILDHSCWEKFALHNNVKHGGEDGAKYDIPRLKDVYSRNFDMSPSRQIWTKWQFKSQANTKIFLQMMIEFECVSALRYVVELMFFYQLGKAINADPYWETFARHPESRVPGNELSHMISRRPYEAVAAGPQVAHTFRERRLTGGKEILDQADYAVLKDILVSIGFQSGLKVDEQYGFLPN
jgi:ribosome-associated toxin RatA of RatAB toxin-antitoxin module